MSIQVAYDCTHANIGRAPAGLLAGYTTGTPDIRWTAADWKAHPGAVRIDQDPAASDDTADVLDVEARAATLADVVPWSKRALAAYRAGKRPGQRSPLIYCSQVNVTPVANVLTGAGMTDGSVGLFIANWNLSQAQAAAEVLAASGPFPVHGLQFRNAGDFDIDVFSSAWLNARSGPAPAPAGLKQAVVQADVRLSWNRVPGQDSYRLQTEWYKTGFGWVLQVNTVVTEADIVRGLVAGKYRWRVAAAAESHTWSAWKEFEV